MNHAAVLLVLAIHISAFETSAAPISSIKLWPLPRHHDIPAGGSSAVLNPDTFQFRATGATSPILASAFVRYAALCFSNRTGGALSPTANTAISLEGLDVHVSSDSEALSINTSENYTVRIAFPRASLTADTVYGALRGLELFSQLVTQNLNIAEQTIVDWPRFPHRGVMIDSSRHFLPVPAVLGFVEAMSYSKLNVLHWHLTDAQSFPVESSSFPNLSVSVQNNCQLFPDHQLVLAHKMPKFPNDMMSIRA
jgi:hexosaminidase